MAKIKYCIMIVLSLKQHFDVVCVLWKGILFVSIKTANNDDFFISN